MLLLLLIIRPYIWAFSPDYSQVVHLCPHTGLNERQVDSLACYYYNKGWTLYKDMDGIYIPDCK